MSENSHNIIFSFIVPYRNRDVKRVVNCIKSIEKQTVKDWEVIFLDYGSNELFCNEIADFLKKNHKVKYHYYNAQKHFWSRAHACNLAIRLSQGKYLVIADIDLIYTDNFLKKLSDKIDENSFVQYQCYYLPQNFHVSDNNLLRQSFTYEVSPLDEGGGLIAMPRRAMYEIGGFDEYFKVWGVEDMDLKKRLRKIGLTQKVLSIEEAPTFHQWHPPASTEELMPALWLKAMEKYEKRKTKVKVPYLNQPLQEPQRPALTIFENIKATLAEGAIAFTFEYPTLQSYVLFAKTFYALPSSATLIVQQQFEPIQADKKARLAGFFQKINRFLEKLSVSYRVTEYATFETELVTFINVRDFLFYFIADNQDLIADYAFDTVFQKSISCVLIKK